MMDTDAYYEDMLQRAEQGSPHCMLKLAKFCKAGAFGETDAGEYIYWLKRFFDAPAIQRIVAVLEGKYSPEDGTSGMLAEDDPFEALDILEGLALREDIIEAGMALGIYYCNSSRKEELELSRSSLVAALDASGWDYLQTGSPDDTQEDIISILARVQSRMVGLGYQTGEENE